MEKLANGARIVPTVKHIIIIICILFAPKRSANLPIITVMTAPQTMYAVITQEATSEETSNWVNLNNMKPNKPASER